MMRVEYAKAVFERIKMKSGEGGKFSLPWASILRISSFTSLKKRWTGGAERSKPFRALKSGQEKTTPKREAMISRIKRALYS